MHKPLLVDENKEIMVQDMLTRKISWTVTGALILTLQYLHHLRLEGRLVWGLSFACFCESGEGGYRKVIPYLLSLSLCWGLW